MHEVKSELRIVHKHALYSRYSYRVHAYNLFKVQSVKTYSYIILSVKQA